jgi:hypothetical protein
MMGRKIDVIAQPHELIGQLRDLEGRYGMPSTEFLRRFDAGELDSHDFVLWRSLCHLAERAGISLAS